MDGDQDGFASTDSGGDDCRDDDVDVSPGATEVWYDGIDQDCDRVCDYDQDLDGAVAAGSPVPNGSPCDTIPGPEAGAPSDCDDLDPVVDDVTIEYTQPADGAVRVPVVTSLTVVLTEADAAPTLVVLDPLGAAVPGVLTVEPGGNTLSWMPTLPLAYASTYRVEVTHGCGTESFGFTTDEQQLPVDPSGLVGTVWEVDLTTGQWTEPENLGGLLQSYVEEGLLVEVTSSAVDTLDVRLGTTIGPGAGQALCLPTETSVADYTQNPAFSFGPVDWPYSLDGIPFDLAGATFDTRPMVALVDPGGAPDAVCVLFGALGVSCIECPDGSGPFCLDVRIEGSDGVAVPGPIVPRTQDEVDLDPTCP